MSSNSIYVANSRMAVPWRIVLGYAVMVVVTVSAIFLVLALGGRSSSAAAEVATTSAAPAAGHQLDALYHVLLALVLILLLGRWLGKLFIYFGQPRVIGEMVAGIMLGPSLLGQIWPAATAFIL